MFSVAFRVVAETKEQQYLRKVCNVCNEIHPHLLYL